VRLRRQWCVLVLAAVAVGGSLGLSGAVASTSAGAALSSGPDAAGVTWLCRPGQAGDPCLAPEQADSVAADGTTTVENFSPATNPAFDCFYIYPTVTASAPTSNTGLAVTASLVGTAVAQASRFSQLCRVFAPTYRQRTAASLAKGLGNDPQADLISYDSVLVGWKDYLAHYNHGRPIILIGHSQGAANVIRLLRGQVDNDPKLRARLVTAIIAGGNVQVPIGKTVGGTFKHIPACTKTGQTGCVIAYSSFSTMPPTDSLFGRPGQGVSLQSDQTAVAGQQVLCTNPADLGSDHTAPLEPFFPTGSKTGAPWVTYPGLYTAACESRGGATWLQINSAPGDTRPVVQPSLGPTWGLHADDINLTLGNLLHDVKAEEASYSAHHH
jgi:hypothetical protein